jgi:hypothetical protein
MTTMEERDSERLDKLLSLLHESASSPIGDTLQSAIKIFEELEDPIAIYLAEEAMRGIRSYASRAEFDSKLFSSPPSLPRDISDLEFIQLYRVGSSVHELCYCCEMVQDASAKTSGGSTPTLFYLNGIYNYISSLFLIDTSKPSHKNLPMGGKVILVFHPLEIAEILDSIKEILDEPFGEITFGEAVLKNRHSDLVHGDFSPKRVEYLISLTNMRDPKQRELFTHFIWRFFHRLIVLNLKISSLIASSGKNIGVVMLRYMKENNISPVL